MNINIKLEIIIRDIKSNDKYKLEKIIKRKIEGNVEKNILYNKHILRFFSKEVKEIQKNENIKIDDIEVIKIDITSLNDKANITFLEESNGNIKIFGALKEVILTPELHAEILDENTIRWFWDFNKYASYLVDEEDKTISQNAMGVNYFIEGDLNPNKTYSRKLYLFDAQDNSDYSNICSVTLEKEDIKHNDKIFELDSRDETVESRDSNIASRMEAFKSGIGFKKDLLITKSNDLEYVKSFKLINKIYGVRANPKVKHNTIKFDYRFMLKGKVDKLGFNSSFDVEITIREVENIFNTSNPTYIGNTVQRKKMHYDINKENIVADICMMSFFKDNTSFDYKKRYEFTIEVKNITGGIDIYSETFGKAIQREDKIEPIVFKEIGFYDTKFSVKAHQTLLTTEYTEIYPPVEYEPLVAVVNGDFLVTDNGLKTFKTNATEFNTSDFVYDKKYYCNIEKVSPEAGYVQYKFKNQVEDKEYTLKNGDEVIFSSDAILEDSREQRDFISQLETDEYSINDNKKHVYKYRLNDIAVEENKYKRFELDVVPSTNDVVVLENTKRLNVIDGIINTDVSVTLRTIQNAIAKWNPVINSGFYYLNNDEYYLYSKCISEGDGGIFQDVYFSPSVSIRATVDVLEPAGEKKIFRILKEGRDGLLTDVNKFFYEKKSIYPKPTREIEDYYAEYDDVYTYVSKPVIFELRPTKLDIISIDKLANPGTNIRLFIRSFNDVFGEWDNDIEIINGVLPENIRLSKVYTFVVKMYPNKRPNLVERTFLFNAESHYDNFKDTFLSYNIDYSEEILRTNHRKGNLNFASEAIYVSKKFDLGDTSSDVKDREIEADINLIYGDAKIYIEQTDIEKDLDSHLNNWVLYTGKITNAKRFFRFKINMSSAAISSIKLKVKRYEYKDMAIDTYLPSFSKLRMNATYDPKDVKKKYEDVLSMNLPFDMKRHVLIESIKEHIDSLSKAMAFDSNGVVAINYEGYGARKNEFIIEYDNSIPITETKVSLKSKSEVYDYDAIENNHGGVLYPVTDNTLIISPIPQQYAPIIIYKEEDLSFGKPMTQVPFFNDKGYCLVNEENFIANGFKTYYLEYDDIDTNSLKITFDGVVTTKYDIINNVIEFPDIPKNGTKIKILYMLRESFAANYNYLEDSVEIKFNSENMKRAKVFIETNKESKNRRINNISLNPIYSARYDGYVYIYDYSFSPATVEIIPEYEMIFGNGYDTMNLFLKALDKYNNPIEGISINIDCKYGVITKMSKKTDQNGIIQCTYKSFRGNAIDDIKAVTSNNIKAEAKIINRRI